MARLLDYQILDPQRERDVRPSFTMQIAMTNPFIMRCKKAPKPRSNIMEFALKTFADPKTTGVIDGADVTSGDFENNQANRTMLTNRYQRIWRVPAVSTESDNMQQYNVTGSAMQDNVADKTKELWRDFEKTIMSDNEALPSSAGVASLLRGLSRWASNANASFTDAGTTPAAAYRTPAAQIVTGKTAATNVSEDDLLALLVSISKARLEENDTLGWCTADMRLRADKFSRTDENYSATTFPVYRFDQKKEGTIKFAVKKFESSAGSMDLMTHYYPPVSLDGNSVIHMLAIVPELVEIGTVKAPSFRLLPDLGGGPRGIAEATFTLEVLAPNGLGIIKAGTDIARP